MKKLLLSLSISLLLLNHALADELENTTKLQTEFIKQEVESHLAKANKYLAKKKWNEAINEYNSAIRLNPEISSGINPKIKDAETALALSYMQKKFDEVEGITWYKDKTSDYNINDVYLYFGKKDQGKPWLRFKLRFAKSDWVFFNELLFNIDGERIAYIPNLGSIERDNDTYIWEWCDVSAGDEEKEIIKKIINSNNTIVRFKGNTYYTDRTITNQQKQALKRVITAYKALGGDY